MGRVGYGYGSCRVWYGKVRIVPLGLEIVFSRLSLVHGVCPNSL